MKLIVGCLVVVLSVYLEAALLDVNKDGVYDRNEFHWAFPNADLYQEFDRLDANKDGLISSEEVEPAAISGRFDPVGHVFTSLASCRRMCPFNKFCPKVPNHNAWVCQ